MDDDERIKLDQMLKDNDVENTTQKIRKLKHSSLILQDIKTMNSLKQKYARLARSNKKQFETMVIKRCNFLFTKYTNIFTRLFKNQLDMNILLQFVGVLKRIEEGELDQHDGSFLVGKLLKELYIDSALKQEEQRKINEKIIPKKKAVNKISWREFKLLQEV